MYFNDDTFGPSVTSLTSLAVVIFVILFLYCFYVREFTSLRNVPGPFFASISPLWLITSQRTFQRPHVDLDLHVKYGPIVRVSPNEVIVSSTKSRHVIYGATSKFPKGDWYIPTGSAGWSDGDELDFLSELDMDKYRLQRRLIGPAYTDNFMRQIEGNLDKILERNIDIMIQRAGRIEDVDHVANFLASDCLQVATFGESKGLLEAGVDDGAIQLTMNLWGYMHWVGYVPSYHRTKKWFNMIVKPKLRIISAMLPSFPTQKTTIHSKPASQMTEHVFVWVRKRIRDRFDSFASQKLPTQATDIATRLLQIHVEKPALKPHWVAEMLGTNFGAGVETTAITISSFLDFVISHPGCQEKVQKEIDKAREAGKLSKLPRLREIESLPYLSACLNESKRLHPVVGSPLQRVVPHGGIELEGKWLPAGTAVGINPWVMGRNKSLFGADADVFRPERWFEMSREQLKACEANSMFFGVGVRSCPGKHLAQAILSKVLPLLLMELCWSHAQPGTGRRPIRSAFMTRLHKVNVQWKKREVVRRMVQETARETSAETPSLNTISVTDRSGRHVSPIRKHLTGCLPEATKNCSLPQTEVSLRDESEPIV